MASSSILLQTGRCRNNQNIKSFLRVRPLNEREKHIRSHAVVEVQANKNVIVKQDNQIEKKFIFDRSFGPECNQLVVYKEVVAPYITEVLTGYNCTVFAYGQTGTGKTHTMIGEMTAHSGSWDEISDVGMIPRAANHLFEELRLMGVEFSMRVSFLELYNEELFDLLSASDNVMVRIFDDNSRKGSITVHGLEEIPVHSSIDVYKLLLKGLNKRRTAATLMNAQSSRSHTIFSILVHIRENNVDGEEVLKVGKLNLVDLAGSENISKAGNEGKGQRTRETVNINQSLLTLGRVITCLVQRTSHIPYRESKLTRLLQESLGGRTKTSIIATVSSGHKDLDETLSTLEYAYRARNIQNKPEVNQKLTKKLALREYTEEIDRLKKDLMASQTRNGIYLAHETYGEMSNRLTTQNHELSKQQSIIKMLKDEKAKIERVFDDINMSLGQKETELTETCNRLHSTETELDQTTNALRNTIKKYKENKEILASHVHTEEVLTTQAVELKKVADIATNHTKLLHDAIDRRHVNDRNIESACNRLKDSFYQNLNDIRCDFDAFNEQIECQSKSVIKHIDECNIENTELMRDLINTLESFLDNRISDEKSLTRKVSESFTTITRELIRQIEGKDEMIARLIENQNAAVSNFCSSQNKKLEQLSIDATNMLHQCQTRIDTTVVRNNELMIEMTGLLEKWKSNNQLAAVSSSSISESIVNIKKEANERIVDNHRIKEVNEGICNEIKNQSLAFNENIQLANEKQKSFVNRLVNDQKNNSVQCLLSSKNQVRWNLNKNIENTKKLCEYVKSIFVDSNEQQIQNESENWYTAARKFCDNSKTKLDKWRCIFENFRKNELQTYISTGLTPIKREFIYPNVLAATSPHDKIIQRLNAAHQESYSNLSDTLIEENESTFINGLIDVQSSSMIQNQSCLHFKSHSEKLMTDNESTFINGITGVPSSSMIQHPTSSYDVEHTI